MPRCAALRNAPPRPTHRRWSAWIAIVLAFWAMPSYATAPGETCDDEAARYNRTFLRNLPETMEEGVGFRIDEGFVDFGGDKALAPLARVEREFERALANEVMARPFHPIAPEPPGPPDPNNQTLETIVDGPPQPPPSPLGTNHLGLSFQANRAGAFAGLKAEWNFGVWGVQGEHDRLQRVWLLHVPTGRVLSFDDLFVHPAIVRQRLVDRIPRYLTARWEAITVHGETAAKRSEEEAQIASAVSYVMALDADQWFAGLDLVNPCKPGIAVYLGSKQVLNNYEWPLIRITPEGVADELKPEYLQAFRASSSP